MVEPEILDMIECSINNLSNLDNLSIPYEIINFYDNIPCIKILSSGVIIRLNENSLMGEFNNSYNKNHLLMITTKAN